MNIAQQYAEVMNIRQAEYTFQQSDRDPYRRVFYLLNQGERLINKRLRIVRGEFSQAILTTSTSFLYPRPPDLVDQMIDEVRFFFSDLTSSLLTRCDESFARGLYAPFTNPSGKAVPEYWWLSLDNYNIGIGWPPQKAGTLSTVYVRDPNPLETNSIYVAPASITAAVDADQVLVTFSSPLPAGTLADNDQIGFDSAAPALPTSWYWIDGVTLNGSNEILTASISSAKKYRQTVPASGLSFVCSKVSDVQKFNGLSPETGMLAVNYALKELFKGNDDAKAAKYESLFNLGLAPAVPIESGLAMPTRNCNSATSVPWIGSAL